MDTPLEIWLLSLYAETYKLGNFFYWFDLFYGFTVIYFLIPGHIWKSPNPTKFHMDTRFHVDPLLEKVALNIYLLGKTPDQLPEHAEALPLLCSRQAAGNSRPLLMIYRES